MKLKLLFFGFFLLSSLVSNARAESLRECLELKLKDLTKYRSIVAGIVESQSEQVITLGEGSVDQLFEIGSITKTFTTTLLAQEVERGVIRLDDQIPAEYQKGGELITFEQLATHRAGIVNNFFPGGRIENKYAPFEGITISAFKDLYRETSLQNKPGSKSDYSNMAMSLLGLLISEKNQREYPELIQERILAPLEMFRTYSEVPHHESKKFRKGQLVGVDGSVASIPHWNLQKTAIHPAGGLVSNITDMMKYARAQLNEQKSPLSGVIPLLHEPRSRYNELPVWVGLGWIVHPEKKIIYHNGRTMGFQSLLAFSKERKVAVVILADTNLLIRDSSGNEDFDNSIDQVGLRCIQKRAKSEF